MKLKRVYEKPSKDDGRRILVDRLWPRGLTKEKANVDLWLKEIAPSTSLRKWFDHDPGKWKEFQKRYQQELNNNKEQVALLKEQLKKGAVTLVYGAKDEEHNEALVLKEWLGRQNLFLMSMSIQFDVIVLMDSNIEIEYQRHAGILNKYGGNFQIKFEVDGSIKQEF